jgi:diaminopropionate ammonia-lyase
MCTPLYAERMKFARNSRRVSVPATFDRKRADAVRAFHRRLDGYAPTPLVDISSIAATTPLQRVFGKVESNRFGLPAFKGLGASWAIYQECCRRIGPLESWETEAELKSLLAPCAPLRFVTATDGNHGRGVAHWARRFGFDAEIVVPRDTSPGRIEAIQREGAVVHVLDGTYDQAVAFAAESAVNDETVVMSDTSWPGYHEIPHWIAEGYLTLFDELSEQLADLDTATPDVVMLPVGVGCLAQTATWWWADTVEKSPTALVSVEPYGADCCYASICAGESVVLQGKQDSIMVGMNCGTMSETAWADLCHRLDASIVIEDRWAVAAMHSWQHAGFVVGETGAGTLGALLALQREPDQTLLTEDASILVLATESASDTTSYASLLQGHAALA